MGRGKGFRHDVRTFSLRDAIGLQRKGNLKQRERSL
jgi:hypothetical protein